MKFNMFLICTKFAIPLSQLEAFMKERKFKLCLTKQLLNVFKLLCEWLSLNFNKKSTKQLERDFS